ncbi:Zinc D-Ala-D-Ala carboxypeptidase precursor [Moraxella lacunata]|uniref:Zinc D-Ala-D-Ala carboxypeptidase n=1 Tax=Moraxella lacunata TaxID=477 RepID=A0A378T473_MORLA|nr:D-Ala-D-Ala carboxypeptidase family metallohydrolase [Moraxella lacunata]STZ55612.1 Zinc D-Ala-D-Ala carboxypeptidase precursor [Moraxella lacunata]
MTIKEIQTAIGTTPDGIWGEKSKSALRQALKEGVKIPITANITLNELLASQTATRYNIDNMPNAQVLANLIESAVNLWQPARDILGHPIFITSGYRCLTLNRRIGGAKNSAHLHGYAIDFSCPAFGNTRAVVKHLADEFKKRGIN